MCFKPSVISYVFVIFAFTTPSFGQTPGEAFLAYERGEFEKSASMFFRILENQTTSLAKEEAEYGLAMSLLRAKYFLASLKYFEEIVHRGEKHAFFVKAVEGMLDSTANAGGEVLIAQVLDGLYDKNRDTLSKVKKEMLQRIHLMIAKRALSRGNEVESIDFAKTLDSRHKDYARAQYILGLGILKQDYQRALSHFENARKAAKNSDLKSMATLAIARMHYEEGFAKSDDKERHLLMERSVNEYQAIPRFSLLWPEALFEQAWAYTLMEKYGEALGSLYAFEHPYFENALFPEIGVLRATIYWTNCQWDKVDEILNEFHARYDSLLAELKKVQLETIDDLRWFQLWQKSNLPQKIRAHIMRDPQYEVFASLSQQIENERLFFSQSKMPFAKAVGLYLDKAREELKKSMGRWVKSNIQYLHTEIDNMMTRASLISLETKTAQAKSLENGEKVAVLTEGVVDRAGGEFWWNKENERWIDELGYHRFAIRSECSQKGEL